MNSPPPFSAKSRRLPALAATLALHLALLLLWQFSRPHLDTASADTARIQWINIAAPHPLPQPVAAAVAPPPMARTLQRAAPRPTATPPARRAPAALPAANVPAAATAVNEAIAEVPPALSAADMLKQARKDLVSIEKDLKKEFPEPRVKAPRNTPQSRLEKGMDLAYEMAPPKWYEQAKIKELSVPGSPGVRRYRITTALGTYCVTYPANNSAAFDSMQQGGKPKKSTCPIEF